MRPLHPLGTDAPIYPQHPSTGMTHRGFAVLLLVMAWAIGFTALVVLAEDNGTNMTAGTPTASPWAPLGYSLTVGTGGALAYAMAGLWRASATEAVDPRKMGETLAIGFALGFAFWLLNLPVDGPQWLPVFGFVTLLVDRGWKGVRDRLKPRRPLRTDTPFISSTTATAPPPQVLSVTFPGTGEPPAEKKDAGGDVSPPVAENPKVTD